MQTKLPFTAKFWANYSISLEKSPFWNLLYMISRASILGIGGRNPQILGRGSWSSQGGREILLSLYLIMYMKYVRKRWLLKRNIIICPEVTVNGPSLPKRSNFFVKLHEKIEIFRKICLEKSNIFFTRIHDPSHLKKIDAAAWQDMFHDLSTTPSRPPP